MRTPFLAASLIVVAAVPYASAQGLGEGWEVDGQAEAVLVGSTVDDDGQLKAKRLLGEVSLRATAKKTLENSAQIGFRFEAKAQQDNPARAGFTGNIQPIGASSAVLPSLQLRGAFSGLTRSGPVEDASLQGSIETAQIYIDGGYGQLSAGLGRGASARFHEGAPDIFTHTKAANAKLDPGGLNIVRTENDVTGPSPKITYQTPRILGVRAGISFTPDVNIAGVDRDAVRSVPGTLTPEIKNVIEGSVQLSRKLNEQNVRVRASASYTAGEVSAANPALAVEDLKVWNAGVELEFASASIGAEYLSSNNGFASSGDYSAWSIGATTELAGWEWGVRYGESQDESVAATGKNWSFGGATKISQNVRVAAGYQENDVNFGPIPQLGLISESNSRPDGIVVEVTLSY